MNQIYRRNLRATFAGFLVFLLWTLAVSYVDVQPIGPDGSAVGLATVNGAFRRLTGVNWLLYEITDWMGVLAVFFMIGFALLGFCQLVHRRSLFKVQARGCGV